MTVPDIDRLQAAPTFNVTSGAGANVYGAYIQLVGSFFAQPINVQLWMLSTPALDSVGTTEMEFATGEAGVEVPVDSIEFALLGAANKHIYIPAVYRNPPNTKFKVRIRDQAAAAIQYGISFMYWE